MIVFDGMVAFKVSQCAQFENNIVKDSRWQITTFKKDFIPVFLHTGFQQVLCTIVVDI